MAPVALVAGALIAGCGSGARHAGATTPLAMTTATLGRYADPAGWSLRYPASMHLERSTSGPGRVTFTEVTVASFTL
jgi:hypothetical protein